MCVLRRNPARQKRTTHPAVQWNRRPAKAAPDDIKRKMPLFVDKNIYVFLANQGRCIKFFYRHIERLPSTGTSTV
ncbi:hypothetical protein NDU88_006324 [Pleurodeles waltl]|uniref:Uncharacterized protein n=1 Tax=Pleurodeles waltl TaxID=8319 RepID=A0AAV7SP73_PLEWA|nr:hypothetical protein NDU88_006324 [Pleurodeles waltl]